MIFSIITLFPEFFDTPLQTGLLGKALKSEIIKVNLIDLRLYSEDKFGRCDDYSYGGGSGMVLMAPPLFRALESLKGKESKVLLTSPGGTVLKQNFVKELSKEKELIIICGHYEGIDHRVIDRFVDYEVSIGDYILSGGEFAAIVILDAVARYIPGFMSNCDSLVEESFEADLLEYPHYTRPDKINGIVVPDILLSGNHKKISDWRRKKSIEKTSKVRPDLYKKYLLRKILGE